MNCKRDKTNYLCKEGKDKKQWKLRTNLVECMRLCQVLLVYHVEPFTDSENLLCVDSDVTLGS